MDGPPRDYVRTVLHTPLPLGMVLWAGQEQPPHAAVLPKLPGLGLEGLFVGVPYGHERVLRQGTPYHGHAPCVGKTGARGANTSPGGPTGANGPSPTRSQGRRRGRWGAARAGRPGATARGASAKATAHYSMGAGQEMVSRQGQGEEGSGIGRNQVHLLEDVPQRPHGRVLANRVPRVHRGKTS